MKHLRKFMMLMITVVFVAGCGAQNETKEDENVAISVDDSKEEYEDIDIASSVRNRAYDLAEDVLFVTDQYTKGARVDHCHELLYMDFNELKELHENEYLSELDKMTVNSIATDTILIICKIEDGDYDTKEVTDNIESLMKYLIDGDYTK